MKEKSSLKALAAMVCTAALTLAASGPALAHGDNIYWSIGMSSPGMQVGVSSAPPMVMYPPVYVTPRPVIYMPAGPVAYGPPGWRRHHGHHGGHQNFRYERHERHGGHGGHGERGFDGRREGRRF